jgi:hypothetical protein
MRGPQPDRIAIATGLLLNSKCRGIPIEKICNDQELYKKIWVGGGGVNKKV